MKFSQMPYERPDLEAVKVQLNEFNERLAKAESYESAKAVFLERETYEKHVDTMESLVSIRHSIDTRDEFYDEDENVEDDTDDDEDENNEDRTPSVKVMEMSGEEFKKFIREL